MKFLNKSLTCMMAVGALALATSCSEDNTLDGAKAVYITLNPSEVTLNVGDQVKVEAKVTNVSGDEIDTPVVWTVDDPTVASVDFVDEQIPVYGNEVEKEVLDEEGNPVLNEEGDPVTVTERPIKGYEERTGYFVSAKPGAQGRTTKLRATLSNGKYAVTTVTVTNHSAEGVVPAVESKRVYKPGVIEVTDTCWFAVKPFAIVYDFDPQFELKKVDDGPAELLPTDKPVYIDEKNERVGVAFYCDRSYGTYKVTLTVGGNGDTMSGSTEVVVGPSIKVGMWDADPELGMSAPSGNQSYGFNYEVRKTVNVNSDVKVYARLMVEGGRPEDIANARGCYKWEMESGNSLLVTGMEEKDNIYGYDCILSLRAGITPGDNVINFCSPDTAAFVMKAYITVLDFDKDFPVNDIIITSSQDLNDLKVAAGSNLELDVKTDPLTSLAYHRPEVTIADPSVLSFSSYEGTMLALRGMKPGKTKVTLTSMSVTKEIEVTVLEDVVDMEWTNSSEQMPVGQEENWSVRVRTASGEAWTSGVEWTSTDASVITVSGNGTEATVKALKEGTATVTAKVTTALGRTFTVTKEVSVRAISNIEVNATTLAGGDAGYYEGAFYLNMPALGYTDIWIHTKNALTTLNGSWSAADFDYVDIDGARGTVTASTLTGSGFDGEYATVNGEITVSLNGQSFKIIYQNVTVLYDI